MPTWLEKYASEHDYRCQQVTRNGEVGFWIANWRTYPKHSKPYSSPSLDGAFEQFTRQIPKFRDNLRQLVLDSRQVIKKNIRNYPDAYEEFGIYFRPEELQGESGSVVFDDFIPVQEDGEHDVDYNTRIKKDGRLERLIHELITPLPEPVIEEDDEPSPIEESDLDFDFKFDEEEEEVLIDGIEFDDEEEELSLVGLEMIGWGDQVEDNDNLESNLDDDIKQDEIVEEIESEMEVTEVDSEVEEAIESDESQEDSTKDSRVVEQPKPLKADDELTVTDDVSKKVVEGQFSLF